VKTAFRLALVVLAAAAVAAGWLLWRGEAVISLGQTELQQAIQLGFPVEKTYLVIVQVRLSDPVVTLRESSDRIELAVRVEAGIKDVGKPSRGTADLSCRIRYEPSEGSFYADDPKVERLALDGHPEGLLEKSSGAVTWMLQGLLAHRPIYTLKALDTARSVSKLDLKDVRVRDGRLRLTLGVDAASAGSSAH